MRSEITCITSMSHLSFKRTLHGEKFHFFRQQSTFSKMHREIIDCIPSLCELRFNKELCQGTLSPEIFRHFLDQDALYLHDYSQAILDVSKRCGKYSQQFKKISADVLNTELNLHRKYLRENKPTRLSQTTVKKIPVIAEYTHHLLTHAKTSSIEEAVASLAACHGLYFELGKEMSPSLYDNKNNPYTDWLKSYSSRAFSSSAKTIIGILHELHNKASHPIKEKMLLALRESIKYEIKFWNDVYKIEESLSQRQFKLIPKAFHSDG